MIDIVPVPKPRMTRGDRWRKRPAVVKYHQFCDQLRESWGERPLPPRVVMVFYIPMPHSWSEKRKLVMDGTPHTQRPDIDNLAKAIMDALCDDDSYIYDIHASKYWGRKGGIAISEY